MSVRFLKRLALIPVFMLAACQTRQVIGPAAETPDLKGVTTQTHVFEGGPLQDSTHIDAAKLHADRSYEATGELVIDGNVPDNVTIRVSGGRLTVNGALGNKDSIEVTQPLATHDVTEGSAPCYQYGYDFMSGKFEYSLKWHGCETTKTVIDGLRYNDDAPAVNVTKGIGAGVGIDTPGRIVVAGRAVQNPGQLAPAMR